MEQVINLENLYNEIRRVKDVMITQEDLNNFIEIFEILSNPDTMKQIDGSEKDIVFGNIKE